MKGYRSKFTYFMRTIPNFELYTQPIDDIFNDNLILTLFGQEEPLPEHFKDILLLPPREGGLGISTISTETPQQLMGLKIITRPHVELIINQKKTLFQLDKEIKTIKELRKQHLDAKLEAHKSKLLRIDSELSSNLKPYVEQARDKGASSWLNALPIDEQGMHLNKEEFKDALRLRYNLPLKGLPSFCTCGDCFTVDHALSCKKGGFVSQRHDNVRDLFTSLLDKVCHNVQAEPHLLPLNDEQFNLKTANKSDEARLDIKANGFWCHGQTAFFDVRITHVNSMSNSNHNTESIFFHHENEKKRAYNQRVLEVEHGSFTPLVLGTNGGMGSEYSLFVKELATKLSVKQNEKYATIISWVRTRLLFEILRSTILSVRGSRTPWRVSKDAEIGVDFKLNAVEADII